VPKPRIELISLWNVGYVLDMINREQIGTSELDGDYGNDDKDKVGTD
jgi:hypothetical protein